MYRPQPGLLPPFFVLRMAFASALSFIDPSVASIDKFLQVVRENRSPAGLSPHSLQIIEDTVTLNVNNALSDTDKTS